MLTVFWKGYKMEKHGGKREGAGRKATGRKKRQDKHFLLFEDELKKVNNVLKKIKEKYSYKTDKKAFLKLIDNYIEKENENEK